MKLKEQTDSERGITERHGGGRELFLVYSGKVIVTDPCYEKDTWCNTTLDNVAKGWWCANVTQAKVNGFGYRVCEIEAELVEREEPFLADKKDSTSNAVVHDGKVLDDIQNGDDWEYVDSNIGVDSGQAGFFDIDHFKDESVVSEELKEKIKKLGFISPNEQWYGMSCVITLSTAGWGIIPFGAVSRSGYGDGGYSLYVKKFLDEIVAMKIVFIPVKVIEIEEETDETKKD